MLDGYGAVSGGWDGGGDKIELEEIIVLGQYPLEKIGAMSMIEKFIGYTFMYYWDSY